MASTKFIDTALSCKTSPFILSYSNPKQKWLIRKHLLSLFQHFPALTLTTNTFVHDTGTNVNLFNVSGYIHVSSPSPPISLTIWLHEDYPYMAPIVFIDSNPTYPIHKGHPFVQPSGATTSPYLQTWNHPRSNLLDLVQNLVQIFSHDHPFIYYDNFSSFTHPTLVSKREAIDRISGALHYDMVALRAQTDKEIEDLMSLQVQMVERVDITTSMIIGLEHEKMNLKKSVVELTDGADVLINWLNVHDLKRSGVVLGHEIEDDGFEGVDEDWEMVIDCLAADRGLEDAMYALDKGVEQGVVNFDMYVKQVRFLARDQFFHRAMAVKLKGPHILRLT